MRFLDYATKNQNNEEISDAQTALINEQYEPIKDPKLPIRKRTPKWYEYQIQKAKIELEEKRKQRVEKEKKEKLKPIGAIETIELITDF